MVSSLSFFNLQSDFVFNFIVLKFFSSSNMLLVIWGGVHVPLAAVFFFFHFCKVASVATSNVQFGAALAESKLV